MAFLVYVGCYDACVGSSNMRLEFGHLSNDVMPYLLICITEIVE